MPPKMYRMAVVILIYVKYIIVLPNFDLRKIAITYRKTYLNEFMTLS